MKLDNFLREQNENKDFPSFSLENSQFYANSKESIKLSPRKQLVFRRRGKFTIRRSIVGDVPVSILPPITSLLNGIRASFPISHQSEPIHSWKRIKGFSPFLHHCLGGHTKVVYRAHSFKSLFISNAETQNIIISFVSSVLFRISTSLFMTVSKSTVAALTPDSLCPTLPTRSKKRPLKTKR